MLGNKIKSALTIFAKQSICKVNFSMHIANSILLHAKYLSDFLTIIKSQKLSDTKKASKIKNSKIEKIIFQRLTKLFLFMKSSHEKHIVTLDSGIEKRLNKRVRKENKCCGSKQIK